jgi:predicted transcriptional regulator
MCSGHITQYGCGHEKRSYYYRCPDGRNVHYQELLPHRLIGPRFRITRLCRDCERLRLQERSEDADQQMHELRAKSLLEFFRGDRPWPRQDEEVSANCRYGHVTDLRLHPWLNRGHEHGLEFFRSTLVQYFPQTGATLFQEMLDRQAEIDQTGIFLATDLEYRLNTLLRRGIEFAASGRHGRQAEMEAIGNRNRAVQDMLRDREQSPNFRERFLTMGGEGAQAIRVAERVRMQQLPRPMEEGREAQEAQPALYRPRDQESAIRHGVAEGSELAAAIYQAERMQDTAWVREQIGIRLRALDQHRGFVNEGPQVGRDEPSETEDVETQNNATEWRRLNRVEGLIRNALRHGYQIFEDAELFFIEREQAIRDTGEIGEANRERGELLELQSRQFFTIWSELEQFREEIIQELRDGNEDMEVDRRREPVLHQEAPQMEQSNGLYESDPDWLLNFSDWCTENSTAVAPFTEVDLRQDINGWFQHLRTCHSQARLDWMPFADICRDAILEGDRCHYDYVIDADALGSEPLLNFRTWCLENADPAEIRISSMNYIFMNLLQGYADYLIGAEGLGVLASFQHDRLGRVQIMRDHLATIPGAPISRYLNDVPTMEDTPSNWQMCADIGRLTREGGLTSEADIQQRATQIARFHSLRTETNAIHEGRLPGFRIERDERIRLEGDEEEEIDEDGNDLFMVPLARRVNSISGGVVREERDERQRIGQEQQDAGYNNRDFSFTVRAPVAIQRAIDELHNGALLSQNSDRNLSGPAGTNYDDWQMAAARDRGEQRARMEVEDESLIRPFNWIVRPRANQNRRSSF